MISCIVSDIDGTLLPSGQSELDESILQAATEAVQQKILLAAASGRPYASLKRLWQPVWEAMAFICANGSLIMEGDQIVYEKELRRELALEMAESIYAREGCEVLITCPRQCYIHPKTEAYRRRILEQNRYPAQIIRNFEEVEEDILQVSVFRADGIEKSSDELIQQWSKDAQVVVSGKLWLDLMAQDVSKGSALRELLALKGIPNENVMAMGDSYNDIAMLEEVGHSFAMAWSPEEVKAMAKRVTEDPIGELWRAVKKSF